MPMLGFYVVCSVIIEKMKTQSVTSAGITMWIPNVAQHCTSNKVPIYYQSAFSISTYNAFVTSECHRPMVLE